MSRQLEYNATLVERRDFSGELAAFVVRPDTLPEGNWFEPGQYLVFGLNLAPESAEGPVERPLTMTSAVQERERVEFLVRRIARPDSEHPLTHALWAMPPGARLHLRPKPAGSFTIAARLGPDERRRIVCVASDTGLAPFVSLVRTLRREDPARQLDRVVVLHGAAIPEELAYRDELKAMERDSGLRYLPCVSRASRGADWRGATGGVEDFFATDRIGELEDRIGLTRGALTPAEAVVFACGLRQAIAASIRRLLRRGFVPEHRRIRKLLEVPAGHESSFFFEQFDTGPVLDLKDEAVAGDLRSRFHRSSEEPDDSV